MVSKRHPRPMFLGITGLFFILAPFAESSLFSKRGDQCSEKLVKQNRIQALKLRVEAWEAENPDIRAARKEIDWAARRERWNPRR